MKQPTKNMAQILKLIGFSIIASILILWVYSQNTASLQFGARPSVPSTLVGMDGTPIALPNAEKPTVVNFFATWCPPCITEAPHFAKMSEKYFEKVAFVGLAVDSPPAHLKIFKDKFLIRYPIAIAPPEMITEWKAEQLPMTYIVSEKGEIVWSRRGYSSEADLESAILAVIGR